MGIRIKVGQRQAVIPPGEYLARITEIQESTFINKRRTLLFWYQISDGPYRGILLRAFVNGNYASFSEYSKLRKWLSVIQKDESTPGDEIDLDVFYGRVLRVRVETKESKKTKNPFSNVTEILGVVLEGL